MIAPVLRLVASASWAPGADGALPGCPDIPPMLRRRFSALSRIFAHLGAEVLGKAGIAASEPALVLASRHGEIDVLARILGQIERKEPVSPTHFSASVHHTALGHFSLAHGNRRPARAVAAGDRTWDAGWLEAFCLSQAHPDLPVLLVFAEDAFPDDLPLSDGFRQPPGGRAFLLAPGEPVATDLGTVALEPRRAAEAVGPAALDAWIADPARGALTLCAQGASLLFDPVYPHPSGLLPHKPPMVLIDRMERAEPLRARARVRIHPGAPFFRDGSVPAIAGIEYLAQTVGALSGWNGRRAGQDPKIGFLLSVRGYESAVGAFPDGSDLRIEVVHEWGDAEMMRFEGRISDARDGRHLAGCTLNVFGPDDPRAFLENS